MRVLSIDPGVSSGWAVLSMEFEPQLIEAGIFLMKPGPVQAKRQMKNPSELVKHLVDEHYIVSAIIEDQYVGKNPSTAIKTGRNSGRWQEACIVAGLEVDFLEPATWQHKVLKGLLRGRSSKRKERKAAAEHFVKMVYTQTLPGDAADAACMGRYAAIQLNNKLRHPKK